MRERLNRLDPAVGPDRDLPPMLRAALPAAAIPVIRALRDCRCGRVLDLVSFADRLGHRREGALDAIASAEQALHRVFGLHVLPPHRGWEEVATSASPVEDGDAPVTQIELASRFVELFEAGPNLLAPSPSLPDFGPEPNAWVAAIAARGERPSGSGLHLVLRCRGDGRREAADLAALLAEAGLRTTLVEGGSKDLAAALLRVEIHAGIRSSVVVVEKGRLIEPRSADDSWADAPDAAPETSASFPASLVPALLAMRSPVVWCVDADAEVPAHLDGLIAGGIGPLRPQASWARTAFADAIGSGVGPGGIAAIAAVTDDPRDARSRASAARLLAGTGLDIDDACRLVARSLVATKQPAGEASAIDLELYADEEIALLHARAREVALAGGRILFHGPAGGGKSALARAIADRMAHGDAGGAGVAGPAVVIDSASLLVRQYGGTERILERIWRRAEITRSPLLIDELDAMCGVRDASGSSSGNAYLVRTLTDEWLRRFDAHPDVPVLATCNDLHAVDPAILRRFTSDHAVGGELPARLERRAWTSILGMEPPSGWKAIGAAPADFATAAKRCRMLGFDDAASLSAAVQRARALRCGRVHVPRKAPGVVH